MTETLEAANAEAFGERMLGALNDAALILLTVAIMRGSASVRAAGGPLVLVLLGVVILCSGTPDSARAEVGTVAEPVVQPLLPADR
jgi:hypothetical protein